MSNCPPCDCCQGGRGHQAGRAERGPDEGAAGQGGEARLPGRGGPHDEAHHQLPLQEQGGRQPGVYCGVHRCQSLE